MLVPVKQHFPCSIAAGATTIFSLEAVAAVPNVLFPKLFFLNTAAVSTVRVVVKRRFTVGPNANPLLSANYTSTLHDEVLSALGDRTAVTLETIAVDGILDFHSIEVTNQGLVTEIVHVWFEGLYEESMLITPTYPPTII
jgi:hypothetical protein